MVSDLKPKCSRLISIIYSVILSQISTVQIKSILKLSGVEERVVFFTSQVLFNFVAFIILKSLNVCGYTFCRCCMKRCMNE